MRSTMIIPFIGDDESERNWPNTLKHTLETKLCWQQKKGGEWKCDQSRVLKPYKESTYSIHGLKDGENIYEVRVIARYKNYEQLKEYEKFVSTPWNPAEELKEREEEEAKRAKERKEWRETEMKREGKEAKNEKEREEELVKIKKKKKEEDKKKEDAKGMGRIIIIAFVVLAVSCVMVGICALYLVHRMHSASAPHWDSRHHRRRNRHAPPLHRSNRHFRQRPSTT